MTYQPFWVIKCQGQSKRTIVVLLNPYLGDKRVQTFPKGINPKIERNNPNGVWTYLLQCCNQAH